MFLPGCCLDQVMRYPAISSQDMLQFRWPRWPPRCTFGHIQKIRWRLWPDWHGSFVTFGHGRPIGRRHRRRFAGFSKGSKITINTVIIGTGICVMSFAEILEHHVQFVKRRCHWNWRHDLEYRLIFTPPRLSQDLLFKRRRWKLERPSLNQTRTLLSDFLLSLPCTQPHNIYINLDESRKIWWRFLILFVLILGQ